MKWQVCDAPYCDQVPLFWHESRGQLCECCYDDPHRVDPYCNCSGCKALRRLRDAEARPNP
jgi:hypothetical protein